MKRRQWSYDNDALAMKQRQRSYVNEAITMQQGSGHTPAVVAVDKEMINMALGKHRVTMRKDTDARRIAYFAA
eukprot:9542172-Lingulodinium_polyedra.AAC.1